MWCASTNATSRCACVWVTTTSWSPHTVRMCATRSRLADCRAFAARRTGHSRDERSVAIRNALRVRYHEDVPFHAKGVTRGQPCSERSAVVIDEYERRRIRSVRMRRSSCAGSHPSGAATASAGVEGSSSPDSTIRIWPDRVPGAAPSSTAICHDWSRRRSGLAAPVDVVPDNVRLGAREPQGTRGRPCNVTFAGRHSRKRACDGQSNASTLRASSPRSVLLKLKRHRRHSRRRTPRHVVYSPPCDPGRRL